MREGGADTPESGGALPGAPRASVVITSYNYAAYLRACIDSALAQDCPGVEVIVVDDGSTDDSRRIIEEYGARLIPVFKENGGQASAINAGFHASRGDVVLFVDSDDLLALTAVSVAVALVRGDVVKAHWPLRPIDHAGDPRGPLRPLEPTSGDLRSHALERSKVWYAWPPTTGNAWSRRFLEKVLPMPEAEYRTQPDQYLCTLAALYGPIAAHPEPLGCWRLHGRNASYLYNLEETLVREHARAEFTLQQAERHCAALGLEPDPAAWRRHSYHHQVYRAMQDLISIIPERESLALVDGGQYGNNLVLHGRRVKPFLERRGQYWGLPPDDPAAIREIRKLRVAGTRYFAIIWPHLWWLDYYQGLHRHLRRFPCLLRNDRVALFELPPLPRGRSARERGHSDERSARAADRRARRAALRGVGEAGARPGQERAVD